MSKEDYDNIIEDIDNQIFLLEPILKRKNKNSTLDKMEIYYITASHIRFSGHMKRLKEVKLDKKGISTINKYKSIYNDIESIIDRQAITEMKENMNTIQ